MFWDKTSFNAVQQKEDILIDVQQNAFASDNLMENFPLIIKEKVKSPAIVTIDNNFEVGLHRLSTNTQNEVLDNLFTLHSAGVSLFPDHKNIVAELYKVGDLDFDIFKLAELTQNMQLLVVMYHLFYEYNFEHTLKIDRETFKRYFYIINTSYRLNPYHNAIHATDVVQTSFFLLKTCNIDNSLILNDSDLFSTFFAAAIHDVDHPGNTNNYEVESMSRLAMSYNDKAVLENYHLFKAFSLLKVGGTDVFANFSRQEYIKCRQSIINIVLSTDMAVHFGELKKLNGRVKAADFEPSGKDKGLLLNQLIHSCDISNPSKPFRIYNKWVGLLFEEFFKQGDKERSKGMKISFLCDRETVKIEDSQVKFIDGIVFPLFNGLKEAFPNMEMILNMISKNKEEYRKLAEEKII